MTCPFCNWNNSKLLYSTYAFNNIPFSFVKCTRCQCIHLDPLPDEKTLNIAYSEQYYGQGDSKFIQPVEKIIGFFLRQRSRLIDSLLRGKGRVLDMGCGNGKFLLFLSRMGNYELHGIERPGNSAERAKKNQELHIHEGEIDKIHIDGKFNAITLFHVFEHLTKPSVTLDKIDKLLHSGGYLVLTVPNIDSTQSRLFKGFWFHLDIPRHIFFFEPKEFTSIMSKRGYKLISQNSFSLEHSIWGFYQSLMNLLFNERDLFFEILKGNKELLKKKSPLFLLQLILLIPVLPLAGIEFLVSGLLGRGVQKEYVFQKN